MNSQVQEKAEVEHKPLRNSFEAKMALVSGVTCVNTAGKHGDGGGLGPLLALPRHEKLRLHRSGDSALVCRESEEGHVDD